jgi:hypothetical protein
MLHWAISVLTCDRQVSYLERTRASLRRAGWPVHSTYIDTARAGCYRGWRSALAHLLHESPAADFLLLCEDDIAVTAGCRDLLDLYPPDPHAINSLYCAAPNHDDSVFGWHGVARLPRCALGALAYAMTPDMARRFLADPPLPDWADGTDMAMGKFCQRERLPYMVHSPSLVQHIGTVSSLREPSHDEQSRHAKRWLKSLELV